MGAGALDWNWFFSSVAQSVAALVGIFAAFIITKIINSQADFQRKNTRLRELLAMSAKYRDALKDRSFDWYNKRRLEYALERIEYIDKDEEFKEPEDYYDEFNFPHYLPRSEVLQSIDEELNRERAKRNAPEPKRDPYSYWAGPDISSVRFQTQLDQQIRDSVNAEGERIAALILEVRQHIRLVELHLAQLEGNPESSSLISSSIVGAVLLFVLGVIYPLSFLPVRTDRPITYSVLAFFPLLFSFKGVLLTAISVIFLAIMLTFWRVNFSLRYDSFEMDRLRIAGKIENYSEYLRIMKQNEEDQRNWSEAKPKVSATT